MVFLAKAYPELTLQAVKVNLVFVVSVIEGGAKRLAKLNEVELRLWDNTLTGRFEKQPATGQPRNAAGYPVTDANGQVQFPDLDGLVDIRGKNDFVFVMKHMVTGDTKEEWIYLGSTDWEYPAGTVKAYQTMGLGKVLAAARSGISLGRMSSPILYEYQLVREGV